MLHLGLEKTLFVSCNCPKKYKVCRSVFLFIFLHYFFFKKCFMHVLCSLGVRKAEHFFAGFFMSKTCYRKQTTFLCLMVPVHALQGERGEEEG